MFDNYRDITLPELNERETPKTKPKVPRLFVYNFGPLFSDGKETSGSNQRNLQRLEKKITLKTKWGRKRKPNKIKVCFRWILCRITPNDNMHLGKANVWNSSAVRQTGRDIEGGNHKRGDFHIGATNNSLRRKLRHQFYLLCIMHPSIRLDWLFIFYPGSSLLRNFNIRNQYFFIERSE